VNRHRNLLLVLSTGAMMACCFHACIGFVLACLSHPPVDLSGTISVLAVAALLSYLLTRKPRHRAVIAGFHAAGACFCLMWLCHRYFVVAAPFWSPAWIGGMLSDSRPDAGWAALATIALSGGVLWFLGKRLGSKSPDHRIVSHRFDIGLAYFLAMLLFKLIAAVKGWQVPAAHSAIRPMSAYVVLGLFSLFLVRTAHPSRADWVSYARGTTAAIGIAMVTLMLGGVVFALLAPELQTFAATSSNLVKTITTPLGPTAVALLRFVLVKGCRGEVWENAAADNPAVIPSTTGTANTFEWAGVHILTGVTLAFAVTAVAIVLFHIVRWLGTKVGGQTGAAQGRHLFRLLAAAAKWLAVVVKRFFPSLRDGDTSREAERLYWGLLCWGRLSGQRRMAFDTPREYANCLGEQFPGVESEIREIIGIHDRVVYGCVRPNPGELARARQAMKKLRHPRLWPVRFKSVFIRTGPRWGRNDRLRFRKPIWR
jgi:hypothetical protein